MKIIIIILQAILNLVRKRRDLIANRSKIPANIKNAIKAIYDPKKQGMTNYDVIEAYVEDFTNWNYVKARGVATISQHKFIITECILNGLGIVEDVQEPYSNLTVRITGITDNQGVLITDYVNGQHQIINTITEDGIYTIEDRHHFIGFGCNFVGTCNITITQLPTSILKDLSGNGNHAYLYGGKGKLNSGMGVYKEDFLTFTNQFDPKEPYEKSSNKYIIYCSKDYHTNFWQSVKPVLGITTYHSFKIKFTGLPEEGARCTIYKGIDYSEREYLTVYNGENIIPEHTVNVVTAGLGAQNVIDFNLEKIENTITIEQIPDYPDQLCYDGKMYAVCYDFPILTDYTVMAERTWFYNLDWSGVVIANAYSGNQNERGFIFEYNADKNQFQNNSFGLNNLNDKHENGISYMTKNSYNGIPIKSGNLKALDILAIGAFIDNNFISSFNWKGCHGTVIVADHSFTEEEINWLKDNWEKI